MTATRIAAFQLLARRPEEMAEFYAAAFGGHRRDGPDDNLHVSLGAQCIEIVPTSRESGPSAPSTSTEFQHFALVVADMAVAMARLDAIDGWTAISRNGPEHLPPTSGGATAFKFRDPEGHPLEFLQFATGSVPAAWRGAEGGVVGIDHSAITVTDTGRSIAFYAALGFAVTYRQVNRGIEQQRMDDVDGAVVEITGLAVSADPPHIELLCYRVPGTEARIVPLFDPKATAILLAMPGDMPPGDWAAGSRGVVLRDLDGHILIRRQRA